MIAESACIGVCGFEPGLVDGSVHVAQSAPWQAISALEQGKTPPALHFAQINEKDGFFLVGRRPETDFSWKRLAGRAVAGLAVTTLVEPRWS